MKGYYKKSSILDIFPIMVIVFAVILTTLICYIVWEKVNQSNVYAADTNANSTMKLTERTLLNFDNLIFMMFIVLSMVTIVAASMVSNNPAWFFIALIVLGIAFVIAVAFSNVYEKIADNTNLESVSAKYPKTQFLFDKLPIYVILMLFSIMVSMYIGYRVSNA